jgi:hypothetical protein
MARIVGVVSILVGILVTPDHPSLSLGAITSH